jgi:hypothetical protein
VVFGVTSSGRGGQIDGMDAMVGLLINTTPARIRVDRDRPVVAWLGELQEEQVRARRFEHTPLVTIAACSDVPPGLPLVVGARVCRGSTERCSTRLRRRSAPGSMPRSPAGSTSDHPSDHGANVDLWKMLAVRSL